MKSSTLAAALVVGCIAGPAAAGTVCEVNSGGMGVKTISWTDNGKATITHFLDDTRTGKVVLRRGHDDGVKVNIWVQYAERRYGDDAAEYIVFPVGEGQYRVIGVTYMIEGGKQYLTAGAANDEAKCTST